MLTNYVYRVRFYLRSCKVVLYIIALKYKSESFETFFMLIHSKIFMQFFIKKDNKKISWDKSVIPDGNAINVGANTVPKLCSDILLSSWCCATLYKCSIMYLRHLKCAGGSNGNAFFVESTWSTGVALSES